MAYTSVQTDKKGLFMKLTVPKRDILPPVSEQESDSPGYIEQDLSAAGAKADCSDKLLEAYLPAGARVIDMGCGSGRDVLAFREMGFDTAGRDASEELVWLAKERLGIPVFTADLSCVNI